MLPVQKRNRAETRVPALFVNLNQCSASKHFPLVMTMRPMVPMAMPMAVAMSVSMTMMNRVAIHHPAWRYYNRSAHRWCNDHRRRVIGVRRMIHRGRTGRMVIHGRSDHHWSRVSNHRRRRRMTDYHAPGQWHWYSDPDVHTDTGL